MQKVRSWRRALGGRGGNVSIMVGVTALALMGASGLAIDGARMWMVRSRVSTALDAALITAARGYSTGMTPAQLTQLSRDACAVYWANFAGSGRTNTCTSGGTAVGFLGASSSSPALSTANDVVTLSVNATVGATFTRVLGVSQVASTATAAAQRSVSSVEIALALDVTASMYPNNKIGSLRTAAESFVTSIYGSNETMPRTWVSVVPYTTHVNLGTAAYARNMVTEASLSQYAPAGMPLRDTRGAVVPWSGCVQARGQALNGTVGDLTDVPATPSNPSAQYQAWFYPTSLDSSPVNPRSLYWLQNGGTRTYLGGDNDWRSFIVGNTAVNNFAINEWALNQNTARPGAPQGGTHQNPLDITGPSLGCLLEPRYHVLPLTAQRSTIIARIRGLEAEPWQYHYRTTGIDSVAAGGTIVHLGLHTAWMTLSPRWSGLWSDTPTTPALPLTAEEAGMKVIVLMTDGVNDYPEYIFTTQSGNSLYRGAPGPCANNNAADRRTRSPRHPVGCANASGTLNRSQTSAYGPYGRLPSGGLLVTTTQGVPTGGTATTSSTAEPELDRRLARLCTVIKAAGIQIYTVGFDITSAGGNAAAVRALLTGCANTSADYFEASNAAALNTAFQAIAGRVGRVRLIR